MTKRIVLILAGLIVFASPTVVLPAPASAHRLSPLSEAQATHMARAYANHEGHRIYRLTDIGIWTVCTAVEYTATCDMTLSLYYTEDPEVEPTNVSAELEIRKTAPGRYREHLAREWEVEPAS